MVDMTSLHLDDVSMNTLKQGTQRLGVELTPKHLEQFGIYYEELVIWNKKLNLTAITDYEEVQSKHFLDSLAVARALDDTGLLSASTLRLLDMGSGAGLPGLPLKIVFPHIELVLVDSVAKKTSFLKYLVKRLDLQGVEVVTERAENLAHQDYYREGFDAVLSRATGRLPIAAEYTLPFCKIGGYFIAQKKGDIEKELQDSSRAITLLGGMLSQIKQIDLPQLQDHLLVIIAKVAISPITYPRRPGIPAKRPL